MAIIRIVRTGDGTVQFTPQDQPLVKRDVVVFSNEDPREQHLPTLAGKDANFWFTDPLAPFVAPPADTSSEVLFSTAGTFKYVCAMHPEETGTITVQ
jgi:plastocyanin